jgi:alpha-1,6-mannosyltransferase
MIFVDVNTNYNDHGGGIRTYHQTKLAWFRAHPEHQYYLVVPGPRYAEQALAPNIFRVEFYGVTLVGGYRLLLDFIGLYKFLRRVRADVIESGDSIWTGPFCLVGRKTGRFRALLSSFYHSDPIHTWIVPWTSRPGLLRPLRRLAGRLLSWLFYRLQQAYDRTIATSRIMESQLLAHGVQHTARMPFGVAEDFFAPPNETFAKFGETPRPVRLLYSGRLGRDKAIELVEQILPRLLERDDVHVTVMGRSVNDHPLCRFTHPRYTYLGYVTDRREVARVYREHHILLAPGPYETFGLGILEALASGLVVVGPNAGGAGEMLGELPTGFLFRAGDADDFYCAVEAAMQCDFTSQSRDSRALAATYGTSDTAVGRLIAYYERETGANATVRRDEAASSTPRSRTSTPAEARCRT